GEIETNDNMKMCDFLANVIQKIEPEVFLAPMSDNIPDFLPRVAQRIGTGLVSGCISIDIDTTDRVVLANRPAYGSKMHEIHVCPTARPQMILLMPATFPLPIMDEFRSGTIEKTML
ncbi:hypothetical protein GF337_09910, partial [candidate division KSB1 bacterium]|nr:hypothetical protein [candidate division KSB1 bacterium]